MAFPRNGGYSWTGSWIIANKYGIIVINCYAHQVNEYSPFGR